MQMWLDYWILKKWLIKSASITKQEYRLKSCAILNARVIKYVVH